MPLRRSTGELIRASDGSISNCNEDCPISDADPASLATTDFEIDGGFQGELCTGYSCYCGTQTYYVRGGDTVWASDFTEYSTPDGINHYWSAPLNKKYVDQNNVEASIYNGLYCCVALISDGNGGFFWYLNVLLLFPNDCSDPGSGISTYAAWYGYKYCGSTPEGVYEINGDDSCGTCGSLDFQPTIRIRIK